MTAPLLRADGIAKRYRSGGAWGRRAWVRALDGVDLCIDAGEAVGLVGESGSGKTTLGRIVAGMIQADAGRLLWQGRMVAELDTPDCARFRRQVQYVFQNPVGALNPRQRIGRILDRTLRGLSRLPAPVRDARVVEVCARVGLEPGLLGRFPHQLSGGQAQRVAIARALLGAPRLVVLDEPVSALDVSLQAQILTLLDALRREQGLAYLFVSHDLAVVERLCSHIAVMRDGKIVEQGPTESILRAPKDAYTRRLREAVPRFGEGA